MNEDQARRLGDTIREHNSDIVLRWLASASADLERSGHKVGMTDLQDGIGDYLDRLADSLREGGNGDRRGAEAWKEVAREHALTRVRLGFDIEQLVHEFILLRNAIQDVLGEQGVELDGTSAILLADLIDAAVATSVRSYIDSRDYQARKDEAEHIGFVTHELRNPLTTATLAATQLQKGTQDSSQRDRVLALLDQGLRRMKELIDKVLLTEKLEGDSIEPRVRDLRMGDIIEDGVRAARAEAEKKNLRFVLTYEPELTIRADLDLTVSALQNLADNAVKFTDEGSVEIIVEDHDSEIVIHVRDTCTGLSEGELATIFEPFRRGHSGKPGTGLGMAIASRAVRAQGGRIEAESRQAYGCHFWMTLPKSKT